MTRDRLKAVATLLLLALLVPSFADDKDPKNGPKDVKFACSFHGPVNMNLTLSAEAGKSRKIEFIGGNNGAKWFVKIDGRDAQVANGATVKVRSGDTIT